MHRLHQNDLLLEFPFYPDENWKWDRDDLSPEKKIPFTLYKHVSIRIVNNENEIAIIRVVDLLVNDDQPQLGDMSDLDPDKVDLTRFAAVLRRKKKSFKYPANGLITFKHTFDLESTDCDHEEWAARIRIETIAYTGKEQD